jgi:branched-chain amino acid transport system substrate-binding protein
MRLRTAGWATCAAAALALAACGGGGGGSGSTQGVTKTSVKVGGHFPLTGPAAPGYSNIPPAIKAYFSYVNANGGINGRKLSLVARDDAYNPAKTVTVTKQLVLQDKVFGMLDALGTPTHTKVVDFLNAERVPDLFVASGCLCWNEPDDHPQTFGWLTDYYREGKIIGQYVAQHFKGKKVAYFLQNDDFGTDGAKGLDKYIPAGQVVTRQTYEPGNTDIGPQMAKIKASGADVVVSFSIPAYTALELLAGVKLGYHPQMVVSSVGGDPTTLTGLLKEFSKGAAGSSLTDGMITTGYLPSTSDTSSSWVRLFRKIHDKYIPKVPFDGNVEFGMASAYTFATALQNAGKNPTRESIVKAIEDQKMAGPGLVPFAYSPDDHSGYTGVQVGTINGGKLTLEGKPFVTDGGDGPVKTYPGGQPEAPSDGIPPQG